MMAKNRVSSEIRRAARRPLASSYVPKGWTECTDEDGKSKTLDPPGRSKRPALKDQSVPTVGERLEATRRVGRSVSDLGIIRLLYEVERTETRRQYVADKAEEVAEERAAGAEARPLSDDWLDRFFRYVADVDEKDVLDTLAKGLAEAATRDKPILSPRALDALRFFQKDIYDLFSRCSSILSVLGYVPLGFFDDEDYDFGPVQLEHLLENGLAKIETMNYYALPLGDFLINFSYQADERFNFEIVRLTQIGREIAELINNELREVPKLLSAGSLPGHLLHFQLRNGVADEVFRRVAQALLRTMSDRWSIETTIFLRSDDANKRVGEAVREKFESPFAIPRPENIGNGSDRFLDVVLNMFNDFDEYELPVLVDQFSKP
jgi:hypothetical protein